jgi:D-alanyl-D-alanine carboxypeptidase
VLQLAERRRRSLDVRLPAMLPAVVVRRFHDASEISVRMLLRHRSGIPTSSLPPSPRRLPGHPGKVWRVSEFLDIAAAQPPLSAPGTDYQYSNTDYTLLGLIIERVTGHSWRREVTRRVISLLGLDGTSLRAGPPLDTKPPCARLCRA